MQLQIKAQLPLLCPELHSHLQIDVQTLAFCKAQQITLQACNRPNDAHGQATAQQWHTESSPFSIINSACYRSIAVGSMSPCGYNVWVQGFVHLGSSAERGKCCSSLNNHASELSFGFHQTRVGLKLVGHQGCPCTISLSRPGLLSSDEDSSIFPYNVRWHKLQYEAIRSQLIQSVWHPVCLEHI